MSVIGSSRKRFWEDNGFLVLPGFFDDSEVATLLEIQARTWEARPSCVVVDDLVTGRRCRISDLSEEERTHHFKVNDLYLTNAEIREVVLSDLIGMVLEELLNDEPAICNTLTFDKGSQQADHLDTLYMTPETPAGLVATWIALEDCDPAAGPLRYYPGSNHIDPYRFSNGSMHHIPEEMPQWSDYMATEVGRMGLEEQRFPARKGDLFIWNAFLLHGGSAIENPELSRRSLVTHYFRQTDCESRGMDLRPAPGGWWIMRQAQPVPDESTPLAISTLASTAAELRERMGSLT